jgi:hypothetical protein
MALRYLSTWALPLLLLGETISAYTPDIPVPPPSAADYYVESLPGQPDGPPLKMHAGFV